MKRTLPLLILLCTGIAAFAQDATVIYKNIVNSTVTIETEDGLGSGFFVGENIIATNYHVIKGDTEAYCYTNNSDTKYRIEGYVAVDTSVDLILLKVHGLKRTPIRISPTPVEIGQKIYVIGSPKGLPATISDGIISGLRDFDGYKLIQITAPISHGSSGGPVLNSRGELVGIAVLQFKEGQNLNFAIPKANIKALLKTIGTNEELPYIVPRSLSSLNETEWMPKDNSGNPDFDAAIAVVKIGSQEWTTTNLDVSTFRNGDPIPEAESDEEWIKASNEGKPAWCYYATYRSKYGKLYNWYAVNDSRGLAPVNWHIPTDNEWSTLTTNLGENDAGKLKSISEWKNNGNGDNSSSFNALPAGGRNGAGTFYGISTFGCFWSDSENDDTIALVRYIDYARPDVYHYYSKKGFGFSVRCVREGKMQNEDIPIDDINSDSLWSYSIKLIQTADKLDKSHDYDNAIDNYNKSSFLWHQLLNRCNNNTQGDSRFTSREFLVLLSLNYVLIGNDYYNEKNYDEALAYHEKAAEIDDSIEFSSAEFNVAKDYAQIALTKTDMEEAQPFLNKAVSHCISSIELEKQEDLIRHDQAKEIGDEYEYLKNLYIGTNRQNDANDCEKQAQEWYSKSTNEIMEK